MKIGIINTWDHVALTGSVVSHGEEYSFAYSDGRTIVSSDDLIEPSLGNRRQPAGFALKVPRVGDAVVFVPTDSAVSWAYAEHYVSAALRKVPSEFRATTHLVSI